MGDDTVDEHRGLKVYGKARHRDPVRSSHSCAAYRYGHKWVVLAMLVHFPFACRPWALPLLVVLYRSKEDNRCRGCQHKTAAELMRRRLRCFPDRQFVFAGGSGYGSHDQTAFAPRGGGQEAGAPLASSASGPPRISATCFAAGVARWYRSW